MSIQMKAFLAAGVFALVGGAAMAGAISPPSANPALTVGAGGPTAGDHQPAGAPDGWGTKYSEYTLPKSIYTPGDPFLLSDANKLTPGKRVNFVTCPVLIDSDPTPLWVAEYDGETYFLRAQQNFSGAVHHPQLLHQVMVEGIVSTEPRIAGGLVLSPVKISSMREVDTSCTEMRPAQDGYKVLFAKRPPGPGSNGMQRESRNIDRAAARARLDATAYTPDPVAAREVKTFDVTFDFDSDIVWTYTTVGEAAKYARDVNAAKVEIHGWRGSALLSNGQTLNEREGVDKVRADKVREILADYTLPNIPITVDSQPTPLKSDGVSDFDTWHVTIVVTPGPQKTAANATAATPTP